jgi:mRNA interferase MazF
VQAEIVLIALPQADGQGKPRPALVLREMPPFQDVLLAGISSQLRQEVPGFDEVLQPNDIDFAATGLRVASIVRLGFLTVLPQRQVLGTLGYISSARHRALLTRLSAYLFAE